MMALEDESNKWLEKARSDLKHAKSSFKINDFDWSQLAAQQSVEKALKAVCIKRGIGLIKIHDLTVLARKLEAPKEIIEKAALLNPFYTASRYPEDDIFISNEKTAKDALDAAEGILKWIKTLK